MNNIKTTTRYLLFFLTGIVVLACDLTEPPRDTADQDAVFGSEQGLEVYTNSFYDWLPSANDIIRNDYVSDFAARRDVPPLLRGGVSPTSSDNTSQSAWDRVALGGDVHWGWDGLRNINYFLENNVNEDIPEDIRQHYNGLARFFRAFFYFEKVKRYGDVPWIDRPLAIDDPQLMEGRDPRSEVMDNVLEDINFAIENITTETDGSRTLITRDVALALKSRIALFEGTFRKYHPDWDLSGSADAWLAEAASAAEQIMERGNFSLYEGAGTDLSYQELFVTDSPNSSEDILTLAQDASIGVQHTANWIFNSATTGVRFTFIRPFIHTYLNIDGTPFTERDGYETMTFVEEMEDRDKRLQQTIRGPEYTSTRGGQTLSLPDFSYTYTGYQPVKFVQDDKALGEGTVNTNSVPIFRYAEVLLNYAEAKAELGTLTDADWQETIGALRSRAGITGGISSLPTEVDPYLQSTYFPDISDPVILEVRRERGIELAMEGFRFYDLVRWARGELFEMEWTGIYVPEANQYYDLSGDGSDDIYFYTEEPSDRRDGVRYLNVNTSSHRLTGGASGEISWLSDVAKSWHDQYYLFPIPESDLLTNPNLGQNPGW